MTGCATTAQKDTDVVGLMDPSASEAIRNEVAIGEKIHREILLSFYPYTEPRAVKYVNEIGKKISVFAERRLPYQFTILYNDKIYATSAPGGFVYLTTGLIYFLNNEAELAGILAHEIGQLQYRDPRLSKGHQILDSITRGGAMIGPAFGEFGALAILGLAMINAVVDANELSPEEKLMEADTKAMDYMVQSGYDPQGLIDVLRRVTQVSEELMPYLYDLKQSRPVTQERLEHASNMFLKLPLHGKELSTNYKDYQAITKGIREIYRA